MSTALIRGVVMVVVALGIASVLVLADEPTGNLDTAASHEVFALMRRMHAEPGISFLVVTRDPRLAARCDRVIELVDGQIKRDEVTGAAQPAVGGVGA